MDSLQEAMHLADHYSCLVLTSPRAVDAIRNAFPATLSAEWSDILCHVWCSKPIFVVGQSSSAAASAMGLATLGSDAGNAENLSTLIINELRSLVEQGKTSPNAKVLLLCGQLSLDIIPQRLSEAGIQTERLTVYETVVDDSLANSLQTFTTQQGTPGYIVFFSPSIVRFSQNILMKTGCLEPQTRLIAIGPTTAAEMTRSLGRVDGTAAQPDPHHVCHVVACLSSQNSTQASDTLFINSSENQH